MGARSVCWYNIGTTRGLGSEKAQRIVRYLEDRRVDVTVLCELSAEELQHDVGLPADVAAALEDRLRESPSRPLEVEGVGMMTPGDDAYPYHRLLRAVPPLPPVLWSLGDTSVLGRDARTLAIAGSRHASEEVLDLVKELAREASRNEWVVVSGFAAGVDRAAHEGAITGGAGTVGVLACGLAEVDRGLRELDVDGVCVVSEFEPHEPWSGRRAMQRNATIAGLADRVLVAVAGTTGGSWEMAQLCLRKKKQLFVLDLDEGMAPGNRRLIKSGAIALDPGDPGALVDAIPDQTTLFD